MSEYKLGDPIGIPGDEITWAEFWRLKLAHNELCEECQPHIQFYKDQYEDWKANQSD